MSWKKIGHIGLLLTLVLILTQKNSFGCVSPTANFSIDNSSPVVGESVPFNDLSSNSPTSWSWSFDVGSTPGTSTAQNPSVVYSNTGTKTITLTATNYWGSSSPVSKSLVVGLPPTAGSIGTNQNICSGTIPAALTSTSDGGGSGTITYEWQTNASGSYVNISGATLKGYQPPALTATTSYRRLTVAVYGISRTSSYTTPVTITVNPLPAAPTANNNTTTYNGAVQSASATVVAGVAIDWYTAATGGTPSTAPSGTNVGTYTAWAEARNTTTGCKSASRTQVTLTINKKDLQVTATAPNITYGDAAPVVSVQYSGFVGGENSSVLDNTGFVLGTNYTPGNPVSTYNTTILIGSATDNNYNFNPLVNSNFLVAKKNLTITAGNQTVSYATHEGTITQNGTYTISGFVNGDNSSVIIGLGSVAYITNYTETTNAGSSGITITPVLSSLSASNYALVSATGNITITKADQFISCSCVPFSQPLNEFTTIPISATSSSGLPVVITIAPLSAATLNENPSYNYYLTDIGITGTVTLYSNQPGNANYNPATQGTRTFDVTKSNQNISFPVINDLTYYTGLTLELEAVATSGLNVFYTVESGPATVVGNTLTITGTGQIRVRANQAGDASFNAAASILQSFIVNKGPQTITISVQPGPLTTSTQITASSTSGLPVTLTLGTGSAATSLVYNSGGGYYTLTGIGGSGNIDIVGNQPGNVNFIPAAQIIQRIVIGKTNQTIAFSPIANQTYSPSLTMSLSGTASSGLTVSYSVISGPASVSGNTLTITGAGTVIVEASQAGNATYNPAPKVTRQFEVGKATPEITLANIVKTYGDGSFTITPVSTSAGPYSFISGNNDVFTISGNTASIISAGNTTLDITQQPTANYFGKIKTVLFTVNKATSSISMTGATTFTYDGTHQGPETSTVTGSSGSVTYSYSGSGYGPSTIKPENAGTYEATATVADDDNYFGIISAPYVFIISKADANISVAPYTFTYDGFSHSSIGSAEGVSTEALSGLNLSGTTHTDAGIYNNDPWTFTDVTGNYKDASGTVNNVILQKDLTITARDKAKCFGENFIFDGTEFTTAGLVNPETIGTVILTSTGAGPAAVAGTYAITPSGATGGTFNPSNYSITYFDGEMLVNPVPTLTNAIQAAPVCDGNTATINLIGLLAGTTFTLEYSINNVAQTHFTGLLADGSGNSSFTTPVLSAANNGQILQITGITIESETPNCSKTFTQNVTLNVNSLPTLTGVSQAASVCEGSSVTINLTGLQPGSTFNLTYVLDGDAPKLLTGLTADGSGNSSFTTATLPLSYNGATLQITSIENSATGCTQTFSQNVIVVIDPLSEGGTATATDAVVCENSGTTIILSGNTGSIQWQQSADGTNGWTNVTGGSGATTAIYTTPNLTVSTYFRAVVTSGACAPENSTVTSVTVEPLPALTGASQAAVVCDGSAATINLEGLQTNSTITIGYTINGGAPILVTGLTADGLGNSSFTTPALSVANNGQILQIIGIENETTSCIQTFTQNVILVVDPVSVAGTVSANQSICYGNAPANITLSAETGAIQWQVSTDNLIFTDISGAISSTLTSAQMGTLTTTKYYRAKVTSGVCAPEYSAAVTVTVNSLPSPPTATNAQICIGSTATLSASGAISGQVYKWYNAASAGTLLKTSTSNTDNKYTTQVLGVTTNFWVSIQSAAGCESTRTKVTATFPAVSPDSQTTSGNDSWIGHVYDGTTLNSTAYYGYYTENQTFLQGFGGNTTCFNLSSSLGSRSIYTETYSVRYRMTTSLSGCYLVNLRGDDGIRLFVNGTKIFDRWVDQGPTNYNNVLLPLTTNSQLVYEYYENGGQNEVAFQSLYKIVNNVLTGGTNQTICAGNLASQISATANLTANNVALPAGITTTWQWYYSNSPTNPGTSISGATNQNYTPSGSPFNSPGTYYVYRVATVSSSNAANGNNWGATNTVTCQLESDRATIIVNALPNATVSTPNSSICAEENAVFMLSGTSSATVTYKINGGSSTTVVLTAGNATVTITGATTNQTINLVSVTDGTCSQTLAGNATVTVNPLPATGEIIPD